MRTRDSYQPIRHLTHYANVLCQHAQEGIKKAHYYCSPLSYRTWTCTMAVWSQIKEWFIVHLLLGYIFLFSGLIVNFMQLCSCVIWPFDKTLYRKVNCMLAYSHWSQFTFLAQWWSGSTCDVIMNPEDEKLVGKEHSLIIMNHKYDIDWLMGWILAERFGILGGSKIIGKQMLQYVPVIGWAWYFTESIFLKRDWDQDKQTLVRDIKKLCEFPDEYWVSILLFCEGTRFTDAKHQASIEFSKKNGYPVLKHHLLPRTKGFVLCMHGLKGNIPAIYDCTIGFRDDGAEPTLLNIIKGKTCKAEMHVRRIATDNVPMDTDAACSEWVHQLYREKDEIYDQFVQNGSFVGPRNVLPRRPNDLLIWIFWAILLCVPLFYYLGQVFLSGTWLQKLVFTLIAVMLSFVTRWMISVTEIKKGSTYGHDKDSSSSPKKNGPKTKAS